MCFALQRWKDMGKCHTPSPSYSPISITVGVLLTIARFPFTDRARELYKTATHEKIALIRFWHQKAQEMAERNDAERLDRQEWLQKLSCVKDQMQNDLQVGNSQS